MNLNTVQSFFVGWQFPVVVLQMLGYDEVLLHINFKNALFPVCKCVLSKRRRIYGKQWKITLNWEEYQIFP